ncbi:MAG: GNAT family N-acetyltransferase [Pseudomonadota bacterium]
MIETPRLHLRAWRAEDLDVLDSILGDPAVMEFSDHGVLGQKARIAWLASARSAARASALPLVLLIEHARDKTALGYVRLTSDATRVGPGDAEIGFRLARSAWNQGYATEAVKGLIDHAAHRIALCRVVAIVDPHNRQSVRVLEKIGMRHEDEIMFEGYDYPDHVYVAEFPQRSGRGD